jgi:hypothetical protein
MRQSGGWRWEVGGGGEFRLDYEADTLDPADAAVHLWYCPCNPTMATGEREENYRVPLTSTLPFFGGRRWWWTCPLTINGRACGRRVAKLHLPPGGRLFGCRVCHGLTFRSCQESHRHDRLFRLLARGMGCDFKTAEEVMRKFAERC